MAQLNSPSLGRDSPSAPAYGHVNALARPKIRNSCQACALSKLKCPQQKPTCSRCAKRGITCEYHVAKQGGRKPNNSRASSDKHKSAGSSTVVDASDNLHLPSQADGFGSYSLNPDRNALYSSAPMHTSSRADISESMNILENFFSPVDQPLSATSTDTGMDFDDLLTSPITFSDEEMADINCGTANLFSAGFDSSSTGSGSLYSAYTPLEDVVSNAPTLSTPSPTLQKTTPHHREAHSYEEANATGSRCACLVQALAIMRNLISTPSDPYMSLATQNIDNATAATRTVQAVMSRNETTIEAVGTMLQCSCSQDGYLLAVMSLIIFKVLGWYAAVACETPCWQGGCPHLPSPRSAEQEQVYHNHTNGVGGGCCLEGANSARMAAQLVMTELHRVRYLVEQLSSKLKVQAAKNGEVLGGGGGVAPPSGWDWHNEMALPLSTMMYDQLDADLRKRLRALSGEMMDRLRRV